MEVAEQRGRVMASELAVIAVDTTAQMSAAALDAVVGRVVGYLDHLERRWSRFIASSDVSRLNQLGDNGGTLMVDPSTITLLATMIEGHQATAGRFDPTVLRSVIAEGYGISRVDPHAVTVVAPDTGLLAARVAASLHDLELDPLTNTVTVPPGLVVDPGGVGKGLAADLAVIALLESGVDGALVEIGGDLTMVGASVDPAGWLVGVEHPDASVGLLCSLAIDGGGVATSSVWSRRWVHDGIERHHLIDAATSTCSTTDLAAVTVVAPSGWLAEVHATAALSVGSAEVIAYLEGHGLSGVAVAMDPTGDRVLATPDLDDVAFTVRSAVR